VVAGFALVAGAALAIVSSSKLQSLLGAKTSGDRAATKTVSPTPAPEGVAQVPSRAPDTTNVPARISTPTTAKSTNDLKVTELTLLRPKGTKGSRLVYAAGSMQNASDLQRLGVRIDLDLLDSNGAKIDSSSDYVEVIAPRATWNFRALVHDPQAATVRVASIKEEN
jgi:hypothetical protein